MNQEDDRIIHDVIIIGAGPAGLVSAKSILETCSSGDETTSIVVFDEASMVGGIWNRESRPSIACYSQDPDDDGDDDHHNNNILVEASSQPVFRSLGTNLPKDVMSFQDFPHSPDEPFFQNPEQVCNYYKKYEKHHGLQQYINYNTRVERCYKEEKEGHDSIWIVETVSTLNDGEKERQRQSVWKSKYLLVCTGHFRKAFSPDIRGLKHFTGRLMHSSAFDTEEDFHQKTVLIVGAGVSGVDLARVLAEYGSCTRIVVSVRTWKRLHTVLLKSKIQKYGLIVRRGVDRITPNGEVRFVVQAEEHNNKPGDDGWYTENVPETEKPDVIFFATGYRYHYPFLRPPEQRSYLSDPKGFKMERLYKRVVFIDDPTLAFLGVTNMNLSHAIVIEYQARWYAESVLRQRHLQTLTLERMEQEVQSRSDDKTQDQLGTKFAGYCNSLAEDIPGENGFWRQILTRRIPLHLRSLWVRRHPSIYWFVATMVVLPLLATCWTYSKRNGSPFQQ
jgi:cation diffusion facilitator CzcD-associated flavoprotein CzcO